MSKGHLEKEALKFGLGSGSFDAGKFDKDVRSIMEKHKNVLPIAFAGLLTSVARTIVEEEREMIPKPSGLIERAGTH